jgi:N-methylhydantoinase A/oxoprolinase/acetone carboxylase beta subunit
MGPDLRFAVDIGGTFTDLAIALSDRASMLYKSAMTPADSLNHPRSR